jgi:HEPN domain-containing protein
MQPEALAEAREWLARADLDLRLAERALRIPPALAGGAAYHAQQAAEKALKDFLAANDEPIVHSHNLTILLPPCQALDSDFESFADVAAMLTPYATHVRYPGGPFEPSVEDAEKALQHAADLVSFVQRRLSI